MNKGFTLIEVILVLAIFSVLVGLATISLGKLERSSSVSSEINVIVADLKQQQIKAMSGDGEGTAAANNYGIHIASGAYTLFRGTYVAGTSSNFVVAMPTNLTLSGSDITFTKGSGEIGSSTTVTVTDSTTGSTKTVTLNKYGVVTSIN